MTTQTISSPMFQEITTVFYLKIRTIDPTVAMELRGHYFESVSQILMDNGAVINKVVTDPNAILGFWNTGMSGVDPSLQALIEVEEILSRFNTELEIRKLQPLTQSIAVVTGDSSGLKNTKNLFDNVESIANTAFDLNLGSLVSESTVSISPQNCDFKSVYKMLLKGFGIQTLYHLERSQSELQGNEVVIPETYQEIRFERETDEVPLYLRGFLDLKKTAV